MRNTSSTRCWLRAAIVVATVYSVLDRDAVGNTTLFFEDFDNLPLQTSVSYTPPVPNAFTHTPPTNAWIRDVSGVPGVGDPDVGIFEWEGWSFARKDFWINAAGDRRREFLFGKDTVAVADPDEWNDLGDPATRFGFYDTQLSTPFINFASPDAGARKLSFDSSWFPECCDDGEQFDPNGNNQTAILRLRFPNNTTQTVFRWESAPFIDPNGRPSLNPNHTPNLFFKAAATNEKILIDLTPFLTGQTFTQARLEFSLINAGDDGWWAFDVARLFSLSLVQGDMNIDGLVDENDIPAFALGVQNILGYRNAYFGEFPVTRGSPDAVFDFDDIPWFTSLLESSGVGSAAALLQEALQAGDVPEPSGFAMLVVGTTVFAGRRCCRRRPIIV